MDQLFQWSRFLKNIPMILPYLPMTFVIVLYATVFGIILALAVTLIQIKKIPVLSQISRVYVSFMRGTPMLVQLMLIYYGLPVLVDSAFGTNINATWPASVFGYITFILNQGAFLSAIFYGAITSVPVGQTEAGLSIGLTEGQVYRRIVLPQMVRVAIPPFGSDLVGVFLNTSLVFMIGVTDIMGRAKTIGTATQHVLEAYVFIALIYITISLLVRLFFYLLGKYSYQVKRFAMDAQFAVRKILLRKLLTRKKCLRPHD